MSFLDRLLGRTKGFKFGAVGGALSAPPEGTNRSNLNSYNNNYSVYGITSRIATAVSEVKWELFKKNPDGTRTQINQSPILKLLDFVNELQTGQELIFLTTLHRDLGGVAYWFLVNNGLGVPG